MSHHRFPHCQHSEKPFFEQSIGPLSSQNPSVCMGMTASLRVARSGGDAEFRAVLCLPVIPKAPGAEYRMNKLFGHAETAIQRLFSFAGTRGDPARTGCYRKRVLHGRWSSVMLPQKIPVHPHATRGVGDHVPVPIASAIYTVIGSANVVSTASATFVTSSAVHSFARALLSHAWRPGSPAGPRFALPRPFPIRP
jgi:hypothetical protein